MISHKGGVGVNFSNDWISQNQSRFRGNVLYAKDLKKDAFLSWRAGLSLGYQSIRFDYENILFGDQIEFSRGVSAEVLPTENVNGIISSVGTIVYNQFFWLGYALRDVYIPFQSSLSYKGYLQHSLYGGWNILINRRSSYKTAHPSQRKDIFLRPAVVIENNGRFWYTSLGGSFVYSFLSLGVWMKELPFEAESDLTPNSMVLFFGFNYKNWSIGYSFDNSLAKSPSIFQNSHEITLSFSPKATVAFKKKGSRMQFINCPGFLY